MAAAQPAPLTFRQVLGIGPMRRLWYAQIISLLGDFVAVFAILSVASFRFRATATEMTWISICYMLPTAVLGPVSGVFVDRWPVKRTMIISDLLRAVLASALLFVTETVHFYPILFGIGLLSTLFGPAQGVAIRSLVPAHGLLAANTLMQQVFFIMRIAGPGVAGLMVSNFGAQSCYVADVLSFLASAALIAPLVIVRPAAPNAQLSEAHAKAEGLHRVWLDMRAGFQFILHHATLLFVVAALGAATFAIGCFAPLIAVYVRDVLHKETGLFTAANAAIGVGLVGGASTVRPLAAKFSAATFVFSGQGLLLVAVLLLGLTGSPVLTVLACLLTGVSIACVMIPSQTLIQSETPPELLGRVGSTVMSVAFASQVVGLLLSGVLEHWVGIRNVFLLIAGLLTLQVAAGAGYRRSGRMA
ncbi:MAG: MFS transporter [Bryobacteraceae bacterium]|nr:MFS transporter [Bryobacteraceae bacterium]